MCSTGCLFSAQKCIKSERTKNHRDTQKSKKKRKNPRGKNGKSKSNSTTWTLTFIFKGYLRDSSSKEVSLPQLEKILKSKGEKIQLDPYACKKQDRVLESWVPFQISRWILDTPFSLTHTHTYACRYPSLQALHALQRWEESTERDGVNQMESCATNSCLPSPLPAPPLPSQHVRKGSTSGRKRLAPYKARNTF